MHSDPALGVLRDIAHHIELASSFVAGITFEAFRDDLRTVYAVTRCLEITRRVTPTTRPVGTCCRPPRRDRQYRRSVSRHGLRTGTRAFLKSLVSRVTTVSP